MVIAAELRPHQVVRMDDQVWRVLEVKAHGGGAQTRGVVHARFLNVKTRNETERRFRPEDRLEEAEIQMKSLTYSYRHGDEYHFLDPRTYETTPVPAALLGPFLPFLTDELPVQMEFLVGEVIGCRFPDSVELKVASTGPTHHQAEANVWKDAFLDNGMTVKVPLFVETGDRIRLDVRTQKYLERMRK